MVGACLHPTNLLNSLLLSPSSSFNTQTKRVRTYSFNNTSHLTYTSSSSLSLRIKWPPHGVCVVSCLPSNARTSSLPSTKLFVSGLSFRTTKESLINVFQKFGELVEVNLVMDRIANRPRGFAFLRYLTDEESKKAIEGMHGKFLDGRVIFVEVSKSKAEQRQDLKENPQIHY